MLDIKLIREREADVRRALETRGALQCEYRVLHADGNYRWFQCTIANRIDDPEVRGVVMSMHDIDARRRSEERARPEGGHHVAHPLLARVRAAGRDPEAPHL